MNVSFPVAERQADRFKKRENGGGVWGSGRAEGGGRGLFQEIVTFLRLFIGSFKHCDSRPSGISEPEEKQIVVRDQGFFTDPEIPGPALKTLIEDVVKSCVRETSTRRNSDPASRGNAVKTGVESPLFKGEKGSLAAVSPPIGIEVPCNNHLEILPVRSLKPGDPIQDLLGGEFALQDIELPSPGCSAEVQVALQMEIDRQQFLPPGKGEEGIEVASRNLDRLGLPESLPTSKGRKGRENRELTPERDTGGILKVAEGTEGKPLDSGKLGHLSTGLLVADLLEKEEAGNGAFRRGKRALEEGGHLLNRPLLPLRTPF